MLGTDVTDCIRNTIDVELSPRNERVTAAVHASTNKLAAQGMVNSSNALHARAQIGSDELTVRAEIVWAIIRRCHEAFGAAVVEALLVDLEQQIAQHVTEQARAILGLVTGHLSPRFRPQVQALILDAIRTRQNELIAKLTNEARFYVRALERAPRSEPGAITILGNVAAVQTGAYSQAHIHIDGAGSARLVEALEQLRAAIPQTAEMTSDQRTDSAEVVDDLIAAARATQPNGSKLAGLLNGLAITIQTVASARGAWDIVRDAARAMGLPVQ